MKKFLSIILALVLVMSMATVAFAEGETVVYDDVETVTLTKEYKVTNNGTTSPAETFTFTALTCTGVEEAGVGVTAANAPVPTIASVAYTAGEAGGANAKKDITITLPTYTAVGIYTYTFSEVDGGTAGVTYRASEIKLVVTVIEQDGFVRIAAVHTEGTTGAKSADFDNTYSAGSLVVKKNVTGILGDQEKPFTVKVTFTAPEGDTVREAISYADDGANKTVATTDWSDGKAEATITLKHNETVTFTNIPYGVTYVVEEDNYTSEGYDVAKYDDNKEGTIKNATVSTEITNNKDGNVDTGISMDTIPYIVLLAVAFVGMIAMVAKKRASEN